MVVTHPIKCHIDKCRGSESGRESARRASMTQQTAEWTEWFRPSQWPEVFFMLIYRLALASGTFHFLTCSKRGAPVKLWSPAPSVERKDPIKITHSLGHAMFATTSLPPIDWPNLIARISHINKSVLYGYHDGHKNVRKSLYLSRNSKLSTVPANRNTQDR